MKQLYIVKGNMPPVKTWLFFEAWKLNITVINTITAFSSLGIIRKGR